MRGADPSLARGRGGFCSILRCVHLGFGHSIDAEMARHRLRLEAAKASLGELLDTQFGFGDSSFHPQDSATLPLWGTLYHLHGPQEIEVPHGSAEPEHKEASVVRCDKGLRL